MVEYAMDARQHKRVLVSLQAELILQGIHVAGNIENLSEKGAYIITASLKYVLDFTSGASVELIFLLPSGVKQSLNCKVKWSYKTPPHGLTNSIGLEIIEPPYSYIEALKAFA